MGIFDKFKKRHKKDLPLIARVDLTKLKKEIEKNMKLGDKSILAAYDYTASMPKIRLYYVAFEGFRGYGSGVDMVGKTYGVSSPFFLPPEMTIEEACKVVSFLSEKVERENNLEPACENSVSLVSGLLEKYGFSKKESCEHGHFHAVIEQDPHVIISVDFSVLDEIKGVTDLYSVGGDFDLFKKSELYSRYFNWFTEGVTKEEVLDIYKRIGKEYLIEDCDSNEKE